MERVFGTFGNPIFFAAFLVISIPVVLAEILKTETTLPRAALSLVLLFSFLTLFYTGTRAAFLALPVSLFLFYFLTDSRTGWTWTKTLWRLKSRIFVSAALFIAMHIILNSFVPAYRSKAARVIETARSSRLLATSQTHTLIWKDVVKMWKSHPWFGTGYGTFHVEFPQYASEELKRVFPQQQRIVNDAHNEYLQILAETGLAGLLIFLSVIFLFYFAAVKDLFARTRDPETEPGHAGKDGILSAGLMGGIAAVLTQNFFSVDMRFIVSSAYVFTAMGLAASIFSEGSVLSWPAGPKRVSFKLAWAAVFILSSGIAGFGRNPKGFFLGGIYNLTTNDEGRWAWKETPALGPGLIPSLIRPYMAQRALSSAPDFFDEKLLNSAQTISDLENLVRRYPGQWKYWEKLGFALAKEIQRKGPDGRKVNDWSFAERAIGAYLKAHKINPSADGPTNNLGNIYYTFNRQNEAIGWWKKAILSNPGKIDARLNLGLAFYYQGKIKESAFQFEEVLKLDPKNEKAVVMLKRMVE
jgi:hypothetical protein